MTSENLREYVIFKLKEGLFALEIGKVQNIEKIIRITEIPEAKPHIKGVINLRGDLIIIIDLNNKLSGVDTEITNQSRIVILSNSECKVGLIVDSVVGVNQFEDSMIENTKQVNTLNDCDAFKAVIKDGKDIILVVSEEKIQLDI